MKFQSDFALSHGVAMRLKRSVEYRCVISAQRHKPIDFAAEGLCLALAVQSQLRNSGSVVIALELICPEASQGKELADLIQTFEEEVAPFCVCGQFTDGSF